MSVIPDRILPLPERGGGDLPAVAALTSANTPQPLAQRLVSHWPTVVDRLQRVYENEKNIAPWLDTLRTRVISFAASRPLALRSLDDSRAADPGWFLNQQQLGYIAYVDRFGAVTDPATHARVPLRGIIDRIPHLKSLGVTYLHLLPFMRSRAGDNDGGFAVSSFVDVDSRLGSNDDLTLLTQALCAANITLCADMVLNHVADDHPWAMAAKAGDTTFRNYFRVLDSHAEVNAYEATLNEVFPQNAPGNFTYNSELGGWVWTTFFPYQWDLNYREPDVFAEVVCAMLHLANLGVGAFRLDSTAFLWKVKGTTSTNLPEVHWLLQAIRAIFDIAAPGVLLKAEAIMPRRDLTAYLGKDSDAPECHMAYHSAAMAALWLGLAEQSPTVLAEVLSDADQLPPHSSWTTYIRCHDDIVWSVLKPEFSAEATALKRLEHASEFLTGKFGSYARGESFQSAAAGGVHGTNGMTASLVGLRNADGSLSASGLARWRLLFGVSLAINGMPLIYMGDEIGLENTQSDQATQLSASEDGRYLHRPMFDDVALARARAIPESVEAAVYQSLTQWLNARKKLDCLAAQETLRVLDVNAPTVLSFRRGDTFMLLANFSDHAVSAQWPDDVAHNAWRDALTGQAFSLNESIAAYECRWLIVM
jgi:amylosucrase